MAKGNEFEYVVYCKMDFGVFNRIIIAATMNMCKEKMPGINPAFSEPGGIDGVEAHIGTHIPKTIFLVDRIQPAHGLRFFGVEGSGPPEQPSVSAFAQQDTMTGFDGGHRLDGLDQFGVESNSEE